jgi:hypothetical protein
VVERSWSSCRLKFATDFVFEHLAVYDLAPQCVALAVDYCQEETVAARAVDTAGC